jgi:CRISPR-associated endonuclease Csn1
MPDFQKVLGLDLGTNSIGFAIRNLTVRGEGEDIAFKAIEKAGVTIFPTPMNMEKGKEIGSLASVRTLLRSMRKRLQRKRIRKIELLQELINLKMVPLTQAELDAYKRRGTYPKENKAFVAWLKMDFNRSGKPNFLSPYEVPESTKETLGRNWADFLVSPYQLRALAIEQPDAITPEMLGRIAYHFIQRRGYASNRKELQKVEAKQYDSEEEVEKPTKKSKKGDGEQAANADDGKKVLVAI